MPVQESANEFFTKLVWANLWNVKSPYYLPNVIMNGIDKAGIKVGPLGSFQIDKLPASGSFQLMKSHKLESWLPVKTGYIGIEFSNMTIAQLGSATDGGLSYTDDPNDPSKGSITASVNLPGISITGNYVLVATGLAQCALDTAGALSFLPGSLSADEAQSVASDDNGELDQYLQAARDQRARLWQTPNGGLLMDKYYEHNETYNWMFQNNPTTQTSWQEPANKYFIQQTYKASADPASSPVNTGNYSDDGGDTTSYNDNAFSQQITVTFSALGYAEKLPPDCPITSQQFSDAGNAASDFGNTEVASSGNSQDNTVPMTFNDIYTHVSGYQPSESPVPKNPHTLETYRQQLTKKQLAYLKKIQQKVAQRVTLSSDSASATLIQGTFNLSVSGGKITLAAGLTFPAQGNAMAEVTGLSASINVSAIDINNISDWTTGKMESIGSEVSKALEQASFIRNLLVDKVNDELGSDTVKDFLSTWINDTLAKVLGPLTENN